MRVALWRLSPCGGIVQMFAPKKETSMAFCKFTNSKTMNPIYINPEFVVAVMERDYGAKIITVAPTRKVKHSTIVEESTEQVLAALAAFDK
jgi:hypothetical protein